MENGVQALIERNGEVAGCIIFDTDGLARALTATKDDGGNDVPDDDGSITKGIDKILNMKKSDNKLDSDSDGTISDTPKEDKADDLIVGEIDVSSNDGDFAIKIDEDRKIFECYLCRQPFKYRSYLMEHFRRHTGERPYAVYVSKNRK